MLQTKIINQLTKIAGQERISFHVPGHKNGRILKKYLSQNVMERLVSFDITEIPDADNLHAPGGMILEAQKRAAQFYGAEETFFLIDGTSCGVISMLMTVVNPGEKVIIPRDCHKSVIHGCILGGLVPVYLQPEVHKGYGISMGIQPHRIEEALIENPDAKAVIITYPNYYGICSNIEEIVKIVHKYDKILLVDEAHGAHFNLSRKLPMSAIEAGADMVVQSTHKTLPSFTQSSMLHVASHKIDRERLRMMLTIHQSTSPSYLLMASLDTARAIAEKDGKRLMEELIGEIEDFKKEISKIQGIKILDKDQLGCKGWDLDITKLVIDMSELGIGGILLEKLLRTQYHIQVEMANERQVVALCTIGNEKRELEALGYALIEIGKQKGVLCKAQDIVSKPCELPKLRIFPREAIYHKKKEVAFAESFDKISGEYIVPYPPGIPMICPGEEITKEMIDRILEMKKAGLNIIGMEDPTLEKIKILDLE